jgi:hypothetical protein
MTPRLNRTTLAELARAVIAAGGAALVLALAVFAASPELHHELHAGAPTSEESCPVTLFANGVSLPLDPVAVVAPEALGDAQRVTPAHEVRLVASRYLLRPERGPPAQV